MADATFAYLRERARRVLLEIVKLMFSTRVYLLFPAAALFLTTPVFSLESNDSAAEAPAQNDSVVVPEIPALAKWTFDRFEPGKRVGKAALSEEGPQPPVYPSFSEGNKAMAFPGNDAGFRVAEKDFPDTNFRFANQETITIEAWVNITELKNGSYVYLIGKGRNGDKNFTAENQNWALRLKGEGGEARPTFLFRSRSEKTKAENYHRWTAKEGITATTGWHHVAVVYTFGNPKSIVAFIDGKKITAGAWDMAGATTEPPVSDADDMMIGTGNGGGQGNTLNGLLDEVAVYRGAVPDSILTHRYLAVPPPSPVQLADLPSGKVLVQICETGVPAKNSWPTIPPQPSETYTEDVFGFFEEPQKYIETGIRADRAIPHVLRAAAKVKLPAGKHRILLRGRGSSRLEIDGKALLLTPFPVADSGGHGHVSDQDKYLDLGDPEFRFARPGDSDAWCEFETIGGEHLFVMEQMVGGMSGNAKRRPELGETVVAISYEGTNTWELVSPGKRKVSYNDQGWTDYEKERRAHLAKVNQDRRSAARAEHSEYWKKRRTAVADWLSSAPEIPVPKPVENFAANNAIDHFINSKISKVSAEYSAAKKEGVNFYREVLPILETKCFSCHQGTKVKGGLKLHTLADALKGGKSDGAGIVPGHADQSSIYDRITDTDEDYIMPPKGDPLTVAQQDTIKRWIDEGANWPELNVDFIHVTGLSDDLVFIRRIFLDTVGVPPTIEDIEKFVSDNDSNKRANLIDRLLADPRWADKWMGYWQDVLAENPNILNPTLNNTGPFRWWIHESLLDDKPMDLFVTELLRMEGSERFGGPAGFGTATGNDVPMAAKGTIVSGAFLGVEMKCARCHDSPTHESSQQDLFELAAMLAQKPVGVPKTSSVPMDKLSEGGRKPLIKVTLNPGTNVAPSWPFAEMISAETGQKLAENPENSRDLLAALITAPQNERFAQVISNRIWKQLMGRGIVEPVEDWEKGIPTHPELLTWLGREFVRENYSVKNLARTILNSHAYQRATDPRLQHTSPLYTSPAPRRLEAEQIVDSLFAATGKPFETEEVSLDIDGRRDLQNSISLGKPHRAWMLTSTSNERDRPSLSLPRIQAVCDVMEAFGWRGARQDATSVRETAPNALQPAIISNGTMGIWLTRLSDDHGLTQLMLKDQPLGDLLDRLFLQLLTRKPTDAERKKYLEYLTPGFENRFVESAPAATIAPRRPEKFVTWTNHLDPAANTLRYEQQLAARAGDPPTSKLDADWRQRMEDVVWALLNSPEWIFTP